MNQPVAEMHGQNRRSWVVRRKWVIVIWLILFLMLVLINVGTPDPASGATALDQYIDKVMGGFKLWSSVAQFFRANQSGLLVILLLSFLVDRVQHDEAEQIHIDLVELRRLRFRDILNSTPADRLVTAALERRYGENHSVASLVNAVLSNQSPFENGSVKYTFTSIAGDAEWYVLESSYDYRIKSDEWVVCFTGDSGLGESIAAVTDRISEIMNLSDDKSLDEASKAYHVKLYGESGAAVNSVDVEMRPMSVSELVDEESEIKGTFDGKALLLRGRFPETGRRSDGKFDVHVGFKCRMKADDHSFQWLADRPQHVMRVEFDARHFGGIDKSRRFYVQYSLLSLAGTHVDRDEEGLYRIYLNRWMPRGTGMMLVWRDA